MSEKHENVCEDLNYFEYFLVFVSPVIGCVSISAFASLTGIPVSVARSACRNKNVYNHCGNQKRTVNNQGK